MSSNKDNAHLRAGVIGLGQIGGGIAQSLAAHGRPLVVYDIRADAADRLPGVPKPVASPAALARESDVVIIAVIDADQVRDVLSGPKGVLAGARNGLTVVIVSTVPVSVIRELVETTAPYGVKLIDAGVTAGANPNPGELVALVGGEKHDVDNILPVLNEFSKLVLQMGPSGAGMATKIARNIIVYGVWRVVYESGLLAEAAGVDLKQLAQAVQTSDPHGALSTYWLTQRGTVKPYPEDADAAAARARALTRLWHKDLQAAIELGHELGVTLPLTAEVDSVGEWVLGLGA